MDLPKCTTLELELDQAWLTVWLNRPEARNALSGEMIAELSQVFSGLKQRPDIRGVTLRGRGGVFCAGGDLKGFKAIRREQPPERRAVRCHKPSPAGGCRAG